MIHSMQLLSLNNETEAVMCVWCGKGLFIDAQRRARIKKSKRSQLSAHKPSRRAWCDASGVKGVISPNDFWWKV